MVLLSEKVSGRVLVCFGLFYSVAFGGEGVNPHIVRKSQSTSVCSSCHIREPQLKDDALLTTKNIRVELDLFSQDGIAMCSSCHNPNQEHKMIGLVVDFPIPADMPLSKENAISCLTCHYVHGSLLADIPQASISFLDRLLNAERLRKSFLLRRNNVNGELCLICHNPSQGLKQ